LVFEMIAEFSKPECGGEGEDAQERIPSGIDVPRISNYLVSGKGEEE